MKKTGKIISAQFSELGKSEKFFVVLLMGVGFALYFSNPFLRFANTCSLSIHPAESYIISGSTRNSFTCMTLFGVMLLTFDAPFFSDRSIYEIARVGKGQWLVSKVLFLFLVTLLYNLLIFAVSVVLSLFSAHALAWNDWSSAMQKLTQIQVVNSQLSFSYPDFISAVSPWMAAGITWLLNSAYCLVLALIMMDCNILWGGTKGWPIAAGIHILGFAIKNNAFLLRDLGITFSLSECALPAQQFGPSSSEVLYSAFYFTIIILGLLIPSKWLKRRLVL